MNVYEKGSDVVIKGIIDFDFSNTFECGQCFRWERVDENSYFGIAKKRALLIEKNDDCIILKNTTIKDFKEIWYDYFDLGRDYQKIKEKLSKDKVLQEAIAFGNGIRILNQDTFETIISFIISAGNNIPRIKLIISRLCENFGERIEYMGKSYYSFPTPEIIASLTIKDINVIKAGFRDKYILSAAKSIVNKDIDIKNLRKLTSQDAKKQLMGLYGIGEKVANCIVLFGLGGYDSFPVDVWIKRIMEYCYFEGKEQKNNVISEFATKRFGDLGGFAQQYLFFWARENKIGV